MLTSSLLLAALAFIAPSLDGGDGVETQLLPLYENTDEDAAALEEAYDNLQQLRDHPLDINLAGSDELLQIPGIDLNAVSAILAYRHRYGHFRSLQELDMIPAIDDRMRRYLGSVLFVDGNDTVAWYSPQRLKRDIRRIRQTFLLTAAVPTYYRAGDKGATSASAYGENKYADTYLGDPLKHTLRYSAAMGDNLQLNLTGSKAAGEPFFSGGNGMGYDSYAFNISVKDLGVFHRIILGQYRAQFGMGLVINNNLSFGKQAMLASVGRLANIFTPHNSTSDSKYLQGVAATANLRGATLSAFWSYRRVDATLNADGTVSTILTDGYHRTEKEMAKKNNTTQMTEGLHLKCGSEEGGKTEWGIGFSFLHTRFNRALNPVYSKADTVSAGKMYRLYYPTGTGFWNAGVDYKLIWGGISILGETALCDNGALATVNNVIFNAANRLTLTAVQRFYSYKYHTLYGSGISEGGTIQNESAVLLGVRWGVSRRLTLDAYTDFAYFPWRKYRVSASSRAWDNNLSATLRHRHWTFSARYRVKMKQQDKTLEDADGKPFKALSDRTTHRLRFTAVLDNRRWTARSHCEGIMTEDNDNGFIITQSLGYRLGRRWSFYVSAAYFDTDDYDTRLYAYERGMLYAFSNASYYGNGMRTALLAKADISERLMAQMKIGRTKYFDRSVIGTAERQIFSSSQTDIDLQLRVKL